jgi:hypothetical protein
MVTHCIDDISLLQPSLTFKVPDGPFTELEPPLNNLTIYTVDK